MFQNLLSTSPWIWAGLLAGMVVLPILIHLINQLRYRRVRWASMDFLLASYRRNRRRVWLKQLLLIAARIGALLLILLTVAQIGCQQNRWAGWFGGSVTHHYVVVDDSYSMSERVAGVSAMSRAHDVLRNLARQIGNHDNQRLTIIRYSDADLRDRSRTPGLPEQPLATRPTPGDDSGQRNVSPGTMVNGLDVDRQIANQVESVVSRLETTSLACGPRAALELTNNLIQQRESEQAVVYLLSDFRTKDWSAHSGIAPAMEVLQQSGALVELVRCADKPDSNLAIAGLRADTAVRVAGVPLMMTIEVQNFGLESARNVQVQLTSVAFPDSATAGGTPELISAERNKLPVLLIEKIGPGETVTRRFPVFFNQPGQHAVLAELPEDGVRADNRAWSVTRVTQSARVLVVDDPPLQDTPLVSLALNPGGMTGIQTVPATRARLRDATAGELDQFESIFLLDLDRLDETAVIRLQEYVERGGGLVFFAGPAANLEDYNTTLYDDGQGIFPLPLERVVDIPLQEESNVADIVPERHPIFSHVIDVRNSPLDLVQIRRVCQPPLNWSAESENVQVLAAVRGQPRTPLIVEKRMEKGRVIAVLTTAGPTWNNWCRNGTFPASLLLMQDYVSRGRVNERMRHTGESIRGDSDGPDFQAEFQIAAPGPGLDDRVIWEKTVAVNGGNDPEKPELISPSESARPGIYEIWRRDSGGNPSIRRMAVNVDVAESDLHLIERASLVAATGSARPGITTWRDFQPALVRNRSGSLARILLATLIVILVLEQILALINSYHSLPTPVSSLQT